MDEYQRLIVGVELKPRLLEPSAGSRAALNQAGWLAVRSGASIVVVHSTWDGRDELAPAAGPDSRAALERLSAECVDPTVPVTYEVATERPWMAISRRAKATDLVLIGKRDIEVADGARVGPTAAKLVRACTSPVWLVEPTQDQVVRLVLAATDFSAVSQRAVDAAAWIAHAHGAELHVVHAWRVPRAVQDAADTMDHDEYDAVV
jgi:nucleotide-binding universal stress UspA family protein